MKVFIYLIYSKEQVSCTDPPKNTHFKDGVQAEKQVLNELTRHEWEGTQSAGSRGPADLICFKQGKKYAIQVKHRSTRSALTQKALNKLKYFSSKIGATPVIALVCKDCDSITLRNLITEAGINYD